MMKHLFFSILLSSPLAYAEFAYEGAFGGQIKTMEKRAESPDIWPTPARLSLIHANLNTKSTIEKGKLESSFFYRRTDSPLYENVGYSREFLVFPRNLVSRELVDLNKQKSEANYRSDLLVHRLSYEQEFNKLRIEAGRFFINYGLGETFNPINTFNLPNGLFVINDLSQSSDGARTTYFFDENMEFVFYTLGAKDYVDPAHSIDPTLFLQTTVRHNDWQYLVVGGMDQNKSKVGGEVSLRFTDYLGFVQAFYQSSTTRENSLVDALLGLDRQITEPWHVRLEIAYQQPLKNQVVSTRMLPQEFTIAIAQDYELHPLVKIKPVITIDPDIFFMYGILKVSLSLTQNLELEAFGMGNLNRQPMDENLRQRVLTRDVGIRGQYYF